MKTELLDLPNEILLKIICFNTLSTKPILKKKKTKKNPIHNSPLYYNNTDDVVYTGKLHNMEENMFRNIYSLINLSYVCREFNILCHSVENDNFNIIINYCSLFYSRENKIHFLLKYNVLNNWSNIKIIALIHTKYMLYDFRKNTNTDYYKKKNIEYAFYIESFIDDFIFFYNQHKYYLEHIKHTINIYYHNYIEQYYNNYVGDTINSQIIDNLNKTRDIFTFNNIKLNNCRNLVLPNFNCIRLKLSYCKHIKFNKQLNNYKNIIVKNSSDIDFNDINNCKILNICRSSNIKFQTINNVEQINIINSNILLNKKITNIYILYIKILDNTFIIPEESSVFKILFLYRFYTNIISPNYVYSKFQIEGSDIKKIEYINQTY
jgi:hypothetical protein